MPRRSPSISRAKAIDNAKEKYDRAMERLRKQADKETGRIKNKFKVREDKLRATYISRINEAHNKYDNLGRRK